jgi:archaellum biogenesis ATPase FlaH
MFRQAAAGSKPERLERSKGIKTMRFGVDFLDDALRGIFPDDLILLGAPSGMGKTQLCCNIALANIEDGRRVHYIALEAGEYEIERRLKYPLVMERFYGDENRPRIGKPIGYIEWLMGEYQAELKPYEDEAEKFFESAYKNLNLYYKGDSFGISELIQSVHYCAADTDLIMIDHVHFFDFDDDNENRAIREIAKTVRTLALEEQRPIILVAHLRKRDRANDDLVAGLEEFHGSSDLFKIATRVITVSPGQMTEGGLFETFFRVPKNRLDGGVTRFAARELFNPKTGTYEANKYQLGWAEQKRSKGFTSLDRNRIPAWANRIRPEESGQSSSPFPSLKRPPNLAPQRGGSGFE